MLDLKIASPCDQSWTAMKGDETVRHCKRCDHAVYNISEMTEREVEELIRRTEGRFCARIYRRTDQRVMTKDCPRGVARVRRRKIALGATAAFAATLTALPLFARPVFAGSVRVARPLPKVTVDETPQPDEIEMTMGKMAVPIPETMGEAVVPIPTTTGKTPVEMPEAEFTMGFISGRSRASIPVIPKRK